jgi:hypothetical protein
MTVSAARHSVVGKCGPSAGMAVLSASSFVAARLSAEGLMCAPSYLYEIRGA